MNFDDHARCVSDDAAHTDPDLHTSVLTRALRDAAPAPHWIARIVKRVPGAPGERICTSRLTIVTAERDAVTLERRSSSAPPEWFQSILEAAKLPL
ncbi:hypothetical protein CONPUDRAFT_152437 [Coniophora puteana RWD-64-598 SS2]|uniref:Uncharacterized protein n=1 Tax=Coniophora puteana (strain RWD-64-598) TaxID=741705 RepID=A0A5M3MXF0_CONPW|nr:uncharacterized protein CONPUDRAFT_152437 [Coniophora puteana RWD-64-598 SS2]EIW83405.1 hypothetical protein CONPUDRAFT_152437 [Coniophora puteana RWD-64-598 SS2]